jgi:glycosyltransferase involved in cell wall biosynthesis
MEYQRQMNILVLNWRDMKHPEAGGAEVHFQEIFKRLVRKGHTVTLLTTRTGGAAREDRQDDIRILRWGHTYTFNWEAPFLIRALLKKQRFDCIVDDVNKIPFFTPRWFPRLPVCAFFHHLFGKTVFDLAPYPLAVYVRFMETRSAWGYRDVPTCTVSESTKADLVSHGFREEKIRIIENSVDTDRYVPPAATDSKEEATLFFAGRLKRYKNVALVIESLPHLIPDHPSIRLVVAGAGDDEPNLKARAHELNVTDRVEFAGFVSEERKIELMQSATLFVNPSHKEGWGITNIEANACGTTVVANDAPGLRDSVQHGKTGLIYEANDRDDFVKCVDFLLKDRVKREALETQGRQWALSFSWDSSAQKVEQWLRQVAGGL